MRIYRSISWLGIATLFLTGLAFAQGSKKETQLRTVRGLVTDKSEKPIHNSVVFLKNLRTNTVLSHFTDEEGSYKFAGLDPNADYEIHAEFESQKSAARTVSPLDGRKEITMNLKIDRKND
ncbi:MAG: carboxypeptidase-like regulatory domain-containing protein [Candidatus Acidiferrum sp.]